MPETNDFDLVKEFIAGDESAFNKLIKKYQQKIYWHARRMSGNHLDADEIVQEVLVTLYNKLHTFEFKSSLYTWIFRITSTRSLNFLKKRSIRKIFNFSENDNEIRTKAADGSLINEIEANEQIEKINFCLQKLPVKQREVFILRNFDELSYEEISKVTGKSIGGLKSNYFHAVTKMAEMMKNENE
ncbi:MAG: RNA polymerase sigma factor [Ignavibacteriales bacterium]|nr:MAG: RNA polymerase sigma factor [Ignavibacteriales bacterium]